MLVLGLVIIVAAGALSLAVLTSNTTAVDTSLWGIEISNASLGGVFVAGMITTAAGMLGVVLLLAGMRRGHRLRRERRELLRENERLTQRTDWGPEPADDVEDDAPPPPNPDSQDEWERTHQSY